ncbi:MAG: SurA N-terminal domain-containing protein [Bdellovibrionaceae bacterium]|nr:SurA N-terminal domain-containing protein [Pseudobdellovibrionaceae bacterium]MDW8189764.1 SurA N-terminal domain-containing protein [Pseudobdellovibrionaceae bacterium]
MKKTLFETLKKDLKAKNFGFRQFFAFSILLIIVIVFIFFGYSAKDSIGTGGVGQVNDYVISQAEYAREYQKIESMYGPWLRHLGNSKMQGEFLHNQAFEGVVNRILMFQAAQELGIRVPQGELVKHITREIPEFQEDGKFRRDRYEGLLQANNYSVSDFENLVNQQLVMRRLEWVLNLLVNPSQLEAEYQKLLFQGQKQIEYATWDSQEWIEKQKYPEKELRDLLKNEEFRARVEKEFQARQESLSQPERVRARHILIKVENESAGADALKKAKEIRQKLTSKNFAEMAKQYSEDPGSKDKGGDLGFFARGTMVNAVEEYVFTAPLGNISDPIKSEFGYHIIQVLEKTAARKATFQEHDIKMAQIVKARDVYEKEIAQLEEAYKSRRYQEVEELIKKWNIQWETSPWISLGDEQIGGLGSQLTPETVWAVTKDNPYLSEIVRDGGRVYVVKFKAEKEFKDDKKSKEAVESLKKAKFNELLGRYLEKFKQKSNIVKNPKIAGSTNVSGL